MNNSYSVREFFKRFTGLRDVLFWCVSFVREWGILVILFLLPWQTRWIFGGVPYSFSEVGAYGVLSVYVVQLLVVVTFAVSWRRVWVWHSYFWRVVSAVVFLGLSVHALFSDVPVLAFQFLLHALIAWMVLQLVMISRHSLATLVLTFSAGLVGPLLLGVFQSISGSSPASTLLGVAFRDADRLGDAVLFLEDGTRRLRAYGSFSHPNIFGGYAAIAFASLLFFVKRRRVGFWILLSCVALALLFTFSRAAFLSACVALGVFLVLRFGSFRAQRIVGAVGALMILLLPAVLLFPATSSYRLMSSGAIEEKSVSERVVQYEEFVSIFLDSLFFGTGLGQYTFARDGLFSAAFTWEHQPLHHVLLLALAEIGLVGCVLLIVLIFCFAARIPARSAILLFSLPLLMLAVFDHYLWSHWSGLALAAVFFGFLFKFALVDRDC